MVPYPDIDPVALALGPIKIHWYGLTYIAGFAFAWWLARRRCEQPHSPLARAQVDDLIFYAAVGVVIGGRLGYAAFYGFERLASDPMWLFRARYEAWIPRNKVASRRSPQGCEHQFVLPVASYRPAHPGFAR